MLSFLTTVVGADGAAAGHGGQRQDATSSRLVVVTRVWRGVLPRGRVRIFAGVHTRLDHIAGLALGHDVATFVLNNALLPAHDLSGK